MPNILLKNVLYEGLDYQNVIYETNYISFEQMIDEHSFGFHSAV